MGQVILLGFTLILVVLLLGAIVTAFFDRRDK